MNHLSQSYDKIIRWLRTSGFLTVLQRLIASLYSRSFSIVAIKHSSFSEVQRSHFVFLLYICTGFLGRKQVVHSLPNPCVSYTTDSNTDQSNVLSKSVAAETLVNTMTIRFKHKCISPWSSTIFVSATAKRLRRIAMDDQVPCEFSSSLLSID